MTAALLLPGLPGIAGKAHAAPPSEPKLAVLIVVDQLSPSDLDRVWKKLPPGGFRALAEAGLRFADARQEHGVTFTGPGHAALVTGVYGGRNGIVGNEWWDRAAFRAGRCGGTGQPDCTVGCDREPPRVTTVGDLLKASDPEAKVVVISMKDTSARMLAGASSDIAVTFHDSGFAPLKPLGAGAGGAPPGWIAPVNEKYSGELDWEPQPHALQTPGDPDAAAWERPPAGWTAVFPHIVARAGQPGREDLLLASPFSFQAERDLVFGALEKEKLGQRGHRDLLLISFSGYDLIGHHFGHDSLELRDALLRLDQVVAELLTAFKLQTDGAFRVILSADHGAAEIPERRAARLGDDSGGGRVDAKRVTAEAEAAMTGAFGPPPAGSRYVAAFLPPHLYLNDTLLAGRQLAAEEIVQAELARSEHVAAVVITAGACVQQNRIARAYCADADLERAGDLLVLQQENYLFGTSATTHGTPYLYDQAVPLFIYPAAKASRRELAGTVSVACVARQLARELGLADFPGDRAPACTAK